MGVGLAALGLLQMGINADTAAIPLVTLAVSMVVAVAAGASPPPPPQETTSVAAAIAMAPEAPILIECFMVYLSFQSAKKSGPNTTCNGSFSKHSERLVPTKHGQLQRVW